MINDNPMDMTDEEIRKVYEEEGVDPDEVVARMRKKLDELLRESEKSRTGHEGSARVRRHGRTAYAVGNKARDTPRGRRRTQESVPGEERRR